jgi:peroxiredoxin
MTQLQEDYIQMAQQRQEVEEKFFYAHPDSEVSLDWLFISIDPSQDKKGAEALYNSLSERLKNTYSGKMYATRLASIVTVEVGDIAPAIFCKNPKGEEVSLASFNGKYVLLDFWASWCGPCRRENPTVVQAYKDFHSDKFEILGVSLDNSREAWEKAIEKDGLTWPQVSDLAGWQSEIAAKYAVRSIPANFLIDPQGKIIAKNLRGEELAKKLKEILN